jgi:hypothetical protein
MAEAVTCRLADRDRALRDQIARLLGDDFADELLQYVAARAALREELRSIRGELASIAQELEREQAA